jgi:hypothetical protein
VVLNGLAFEGVGDSFALRASVAADPILHRSIPPYAS